MLGISVNFNYRERIIMSSFSIKITTQLNKMFKWNQTNNLLNPLVLEEDIDWSDKAINSNQQFANTINQFVEIRKNITTYCSLITKHYKDQGYTVWEYAKEKNNTQKEIHLVVKKHQEIILVQCKNDDLDITKDKISKFEEQSNHFLEKNSIFKNYNLKLRYTMSGLFLDESAYQYIKNSNHKIDYTIVKGNHSPT